MSRFFGLFSVFLILLQRILHSSDVPASPQRTNYPQTVDIFPLLYKKTILGTSPISDLTYFQGFAQNPLPAGPNFCTTTPRPAAFVGIYFVIPCFFAVSQPQISGFFPQTPSPEPNSHPVLIPYTKKLSFPPIFRPFFIESEPKKC